MTAGRTTYSVDEGVAIIELDNPPLNVVSLELTASLDQHLRTAASDPHVRAVVLTGRGDRAFCAGSDISEFDGYMQPGQVVAAKLRKQNETFTRLEHLGKPTIAALNGLALGGGLEIALCCDLIVADATATMALPETRLGVFPSSGGPVRLARRIGPGRAKRMIFTAEPIDAPTAANIGLVDEVATPGTAKQAAVRLAAQISKGPALGLAAVKDLILQSQTECWEGLKERSFTWSDAAFSSSDCVEGVRAFRAKEAPTFTGTVTVPVTHTAGEGA